jgi:uncharacterized membrane protein YraQ (UPF0718 family)
MNERIGKMEGKELIGPVICACTHKHEHSHHEAPEEHAGTIRPLLFLQLFFFPAALGLIALFGRTPEFRTLSITFVSIFLEALPFMLLGSFIGGFIEVFVPKEGLMRLFPSGGLRSIAIAAGAGMLFPVCECAIIPVVRRLFKKGLPLGAGIAFLLGGPIFNPLVALSTAVAYGYQWSIAVDRLVTGYLLAVTIGFLVNLFFEPRTALVAQANDAQTEKQCGCGHHHHSPPAGFLAKLQVATRHAIEDFFDVGRYLVFGAFLAGLIQMAISRGELAALTDAQAPSILIMMLLAMALNLCSEADAFVAASFKTMLSYTAQMAFLVLGPMLDTKLIMMYFGIFRKRLILTLSGLTFSLVFLVMLVKGWTMG